MRKVDDPLAKWADKAGGWEKLARGLFNLVKMKIPTDALDNALCRELEPRDISKFLVDHGRGRPRQYSLPLLWALEEAADRIMKEQHISMPLAIDEVQRYLKKYVEFLNNPTGAYTAQAEVEGSGIKDLLPTMVKEYPEGVFSSLLPKTKSKSLQNRIDETKLAGKKVQHLCAENGGYENLSIDDPDFLPPEEPNQ